ESRKPAARSRSDPGVRMMTANGRPCRRTSSGSSVAARSISAARVPSRTRVTSTMRNGSAIPSIYNTWMADSSSFDITSPVDFQEVDNALNQARKEVGQRYDFKGATAEIELSAAEKTLTLTADDEFKMNALWEVVQTRLVRRGVPVKNFKSADSQPAAG